MIPAIVDSAQQPVGRLTWWMRGAVCYRDRAVKTSTARCLRVSDAVRHICELVSQFTDVPHGIGDPQTAGCGSLNSAVAVTDSTTHPPG